ncbi:hypothetical protein [Aliikangiella coralliicola]|uniref:Uncharacterized protein n=1 Tax=Aliikangiella coralliicola TaxID=2592383 RepID=A0A545UG70_9GAMM|nr:hypothetical protein [Aliikangiella coralliicola]TQV88468.1 hypothetical protein FLL46_08060 [Aliikangiella coralliicola]
MSLSDQQFLYEFESKTLAPSEFGHFGHLRIAWLYLRQFSLEEAISKITNGISAYATSLGATEKFHHTMTEAIVRIMHRRLAANSFESLDEFLQQNKTLTGSMHELLYTYYSESLFNSKEARKQFVEPDLKRL